MGRSIECFTLASLYTSSRVNSYVLMLESISELASVDSRQLNRSITLIRRHVFPILDYKYYIISIPKIIYKIGAELDIPGPIIKAATTVFINAKKRRQKFSGKDPKGLAAASLYIAAKNNQYTLTQSEVAQASRITEVTLRSRAKELNDPKNLIK